MTSEKLTVLVTGGAGFIGSHLVDELLRRGHQVRVLDNLANGTLENLETARALGGLTFIKGDVLQAGDCRAAVEGVTTVFHLACLGVRHSIHSPFDNHRVNAEGTLNVLEAARHGGVKKVFYISTSEIYGAATTFPLHESVLPDPLTVYGASKLVGEHYTRVYDRCYGLDTTVLRIFNNFGERAHYEGDAGELIPRSIVRALAGQKPVIYGDGSVTRDFFYVRDTARVLSDLIGRADLRGLTMNIGTGIEQSTRQVVEAVLDVMELRDLGIEYIGDRPADVPRLWVDASVFRRTTGFESKVSFGQALRHTVDYYRKLIGTRKLETSLRNWEKPSS